MKTGKAKSIRDSMSSNVIKIEKEMIELTKQFYAFEQNNSGGTFVVNDRVCNRVFIEAESAKEANEMAEDLGIYFDGAEKGLDCDCCGDRWYKAHKPAMSGYWSFPSDETTADHFDNSIEKYAQYLADHWGRWTTPDVRIYYADGEVAEICGKGKSY